MTTPFTLSRLCRGILLIMATGWAAGATSDPLPIYRDLRIHTSSRPDTGQPGRILAETRFLNRGKTALELEAMLRANADAGFDGARFSRKLAPGETASWTWTFSPPDGLGRVELSGGIDIRGIRDRDLLIAIQGPDLGTKPVPAPERITERGRVVATYAPRSQDRLRDLAETARSRAGRENSRILAANGVSEYVISCSECPSLPDGTNAPLAYWRDHVPAGSMRELVDAIEDLQRVIRKKSGATLPLTTDLPTNRPAIRITRNPGFQAPDGLYDAYRLSTGSDGVRIESDSLDGLRNGIYGLLGDHLEAYWFQPRELGEEIVIPEDRTVRLPDVDETRGSPWFSVNGMSWNQEPRWDRRNRSVIGGGRMTFGHAWERYIGESEFPPERYPDYYARDPKGNLLRRAGHRTPPNFCSTHPEVIEIVARKVNAAFDADPARIVMSLDPNDYAPMCRCERCLALDRRYGRPDSDGTEVADRLMHFSREIHNRLKPEHREKYLGILIYGYQMEMPLQAKPHERHAGMICNFPRRYDHSRPWNDPTSAVNRDFYRLLNGWSGLLTQLVYYDYYGHWFYFAPYGVIHKMREDLPAFIEMGGTSLMIEAQPNFAGQGLNPYIAARLAWDVDADTDLAMETFFRLYYGPLSEPMRAYWRTAERFFALERPGPYTETRVGLRPEFWRALDRCLQGAETLARSLGETDRRFADRVAFNRAGFDFARLHFAYESQFGSIAVRALERKVDHEAAIRFLREHGPAIEALQARYPDHDPYWPPLLPSYFRMDVQALLDRHANAR